MYFPSGYSIPVTIFIYIYSSMVVYKNTVYISMPWEFRLFIIHIIIMTQSVTLDTTGK